MILPVAPMGVSHGPRLGIHVGRGPLHLRMSGREGSVRGLPQAGGSLGKGLSLRAAKLVASMLLIASVLSPSPSRAGEHPGSRGEARSDLNKVLPATGEEGSHLDKVTSRGAVRFMLDTAGERHPGSSGSLGTALPPQVRIRSKGFIEGWLEALEEKQQAKESKKAAPGSKKRPALGEQEEGTDAGGFIERVLAAALALTLGSQIVLPRVSEKRDRRFARGMRNRRGNATAFSEAMPIQSENATSWPAQSEAPPGDGLESSDALSIAATPPAREYDYVVVGAGAAGLMAAGLAVSLGSRTLLVEKGDVGGDCTNSGCVPSKSLLAAASVAASSKVEMGMKSVPANATLQQWQSAVNETIRSAIPESPALSFKGVPEDMSWVHEHARRVVDHVKSHESAEGIQAAGIEMLFGAASFKSATSMTIEQRNGSKIEVRGKKYLICTGAGPSKPSIRGLSGVKHWTYRDVFKATEVPRSLIIIGAGPVGCELGQAYANMGSDVTLIGPRILPRESEDASLALEEALVSTHGVRVIKGRVIEVLQKMPGEVTVLLEGSKYVTANKLLVASGRTPNVRDLGLSKANIQYNSLGIQVDQYCRTSNPRVWAAGDCNDNGGEMYSHFAGWQAYVATKNALFPWWLNLGKDSGTITVVPRVTYTKPEVAQCGLSKDLATRFYGAPGRRWHVIKMPNAMSDRAMAEGEAPGGFIEVYVHKSGRVLGGVIVSNRAGEMISEVTLAINLRLNVKQLALTLHPYPSHSFALHKVRFLTTLSVLHAFLPLPMPPADVISAPWMQSPAFCFGASLCPLPFLSALTPVHGPSRCGWMQLPGTSCQT